MGVFYNVETVSARIQSVAVSATECVNQLAIVLSPLVVANPVDMRVVSLEIWSVSTTRHAPTVKRIVSVLVIQARDVSTGSVLAGSVLLIDVFHYLAPQTKKKKHNNHSEINGGYLPL